MARVSDLVRAATNTVRNPFSTDTTWLPAAIERTTVDIPDGGTFRLRAAPVRKAYGDLELRMLAYNGSIPGPTLRVRQGSEITIRLTNEADVATTIHWHGIRLDHPFDGVPHGRHGGMQAPVEPGASFSYRLRFPDPGIYWYHPHVREDYAQELGLYGNILVEPADADYWPAADREFVLVLDDLLLKGSRIAPFSRDESNRTAMGRYGDRMLINGGPSATFEVERGEVARFYITNTANVRPFDVYIPGARMKLVGADGGRVEHEQLIEHAVIAPSERLVLDVLFEQAGPIAIEHRGPDVAYTLGTVTVRDEAARGPDADRRARFEALRTAPEYASERAALAAEIARPADKRLSLVAVMPGMKDHGMGHGHVDIEWEDTMQLHNRMTTPRSMHWKLVDTETGAENDAIDWSFRLGDRTKLRIVNETHSDHPMQHPFHIHGQRFLVLARDDAPVEDLSWKDTVLIRTGETIDLLVEMANPGRWMAHCHIAEHLEGGMMLGFDVAADDDGEARS
jgi:FtsP/CotA-like multicopper oxidase with cupredoxin domain